MNFEIAPIPGEGIANVANLDHEKPSEHTYSVTVEGGVATYCTCPANKFQSGPCKHRLGVQNDEKVLYDADPDPLAPVDRSPDCSLCEDTGTTDYGEICWACVIPGGKR